VTIITVAEKEGKEALRHALAMGANCELFKPRALGSK
jgi:electron transfer flavoprotein alpha/beta subunit